MIELINNKVILDEKHEIREYYTEIGIIRAFYSKDCIQSMIFIQENKRNELAMEYFNFYNIPIELNSNGNEYLMLGGGIFSYPRHYLSKYKNKRIDVVEINEKCIEYARKYFYLDDIINNENLNIIIENAINYIASCQKKYDYILIDLFDGKVPIREIYSMNNLINLKRILNNNGIIIINYIISEQNVSNYKEDINNIIKITKYYKIITHELNYIKYNNMGNLFIILSNNKIDIPNKYNYLEIDNIVQKIEV